MNPVLQQIVAWVTVAAFVAACLVVIVVGGIVGTFTVKVYRRFDEFRGSFDRFLTIIAAHGALTDANARVLTSSIIEAMKTLPTQTAALVMKQIVTVGMRPIPLPGDELVPDPPLSRHDLPAVRVPDPLPGTPANPATAGKLDPPPAFDQPTPPPVPGRGLLVLAASLVGLGLTAVAAPHAARGEAVTAADHLRANRPAEAFHEAACCGDHARAAEALIRQGRLDLAGDHVRRMKPTDPTALFYAGLIAEGTGDGRAAEELFKQAKHAGSKEARDYLAMTARG